MDKLNQMLEITRQSVKKNIIVKENMINQKMQKKEERTTTSYDSNSEEVKMISSLGLKIDKYEPQDPEVDYYEAEEYYYCSNERWNVYIKNSLYDSDLGTILKVLELTDKITNEKVDFYCDLWCKNSGEDRLNQLKMLLSSSFEEYKEKEFGIYFNLPSLLKNKGYIVKEDDFEFEATRNKGKLIVNNPQLSKTECEIFITHEYTKHICIKEIQSDRYTDAISYSTGYKGEQDIDIICNCINKLIEHIDGKIGFLENGVYYTNKSIEMFFKDYENKFNLFMDSTNNYQYSDCYNDDGMLEEAIKEYEKLQELTTINHYKGVEIYKKYTIILDQDTYYFGGIDNTYEFEIIYNTNIDKNNCILNITYLSNKNNITETIKGTYTYIISILYDFLNKLIGIQNEINEVKK